MKKEDLQNSQQGSGSEENKNDHLSAQKNQMANTDKTQRKGIALQAGLGRHRLTDIEERGGINGGDNDAGGNNKDGEPSKF